MPQHKAVHVVKKGGEPEDLQVVLVDTPKPQANEVLVKIILRPVNPSDTYYLKGDRPGTPDTPYVPGFEGVGVVEENGPGATKYSKGQRVVSAPWPRGTWQQYLIVPEEKLVAVPEHLSNKAASQFWVNPVTVYGLLETAGVPSGGWLLQTAAGSVLGRILASLAKHQGLCTINVVRRDAQKEELKALGVDAVISTESEDVAARVSEITGGQGVYAAFDAVSGELTQKVVHSLRRGGTVYVYGSLSGNNFGPIDAVELRGSGKTIAGWALGNWFGALSPESQAEKVQSVLDLLADGVIAPFSGKAFPLEAVAKAVRESTREARGAKVFLEG